MAEISNHHLKKVGQILWDISRQVHFLRQNISYYVLSRIGIA